ncbi:MAG TPA: sugar phosphate isomerase/epimerase family protein [Anaeromyxobacter sp.]|nr:sugar phosphate isomerase/epimerase family protein [Anaeromyxobacter sp.]
MRKVGIYYAFWTHEWDADFMPFVAKVRGLGFDQLEVNGGTIASMPVDQRTRLAGAARDAGLSLSYGIGLPARYDVSSLDEAVRAEGLRFMRQMIGAVGDMGGGTICGTVHSTWPASLPQGYEDKRPFREQSVRSMRELVKVAEDRKVVLLVEVINRFEQFLINTAAEAVGYVEEIGSPACQILLDTFHMNIEEQSMGGAIRLAGKHLRQLHLGETDRKPPGLGRMPWREIKTALDEVGFDGSMVMEPFVMAGGQVGRDVGVWRPIIENPDLDSLARTSLAFVRANLV